MDGVAQLPASQLPATMLAETRGNVPWVTRSPRTVWPQSNSWFPKVATS